MAPSMGQTMATRWVLRWAALWARCWERLWAHRLDTCWVEKRAARREERMAKLTELSSETTRAQRWGSMWGLHLALRWAVQRARR